ncbi:uncharacterized protein BDR25DRAFT_60848 [Lindgomyces ingoldianus]|uniref:Uncharacterized protein n=1 Tax=Lindgomyces ingoldianus TaxID=673940 RepID=A0ACB6QLT0_9PLEO|nr:uncharacterized protein BDR25DRAFT_60848 [Lindgomyces ingoldianus]KAF2467974.1 hypothetical protein BDR25DRAFT_60848 [Lindgomyces ingoldianus]
MQYPILRTPRQTPRRLLPFTYTESEIIGTSDYPPLSPVPAPLGSSSSAPTHANSSNLSQPTSSGVDLDCFLEIKIPSAEEVSFISAETSLSHTGGNLSRDQSDHGLLYKISPSDIAILADIGIGLPPAELESGVDWAYVYDTKGVAWFTRFWRPDHVRKGEKIWIIHSINGRIGRFGLSGLTPAEFCEKGNDNMSLHSVNNDMTQPPDRAGDGNIKAIVQDAGGRIGRFGPSGLTVGEVFRRMTSHGVSSRRSESNDTSGSHGDRIETENDAPIGPGIGESLHRSDRSCLVSNEFSQPMNDEEQESLNLAKSHKAP